MNRLTLVMSLALLAGSVMADDFIHRYEGDVFPFDTGWAIFANCDGPCSISLDDGHFVVTWSRGADQINYTYKITDDPEAVQPESLWVEWNFRSDQAKGPTFHNRDGALNLQFRHMVDLINMYGDATIPNVGAGGVRNLDISEFHTYRFESPDGSNYTFSVDGQIFVENDMNIPLGTFINIVQMWGRGAEDGFAINEWDYVRFGTITTGESIVSSDPPDGFINSLDYPNLDRFMITFDEAAYVYIDDVTIATSGGIVPVVLQTRRLDNGEPETMQIVLDRPLTIGETTTFTFDTGGTPSVVEYTYFQGGSCCLLNGECLETTSVHCTNLNGSFSPEGLCEPVQVCCQSGSCSILVSRCCQDQGGVVVTDDVCDADPDGDGVDAACGDGCPNDRLKRNPGQCGCGFVDNDSDLDRVMDCLDECPGEDDLIDANFNGTPDCVEQQVVIPAVSDWGMAVLILSLLIAIKITSDRQPKVTK